MTFTCPRRQAEGHANPKSLNVLDGPDRDEWNPDGTCSYDGSIGGEEFMAYVRAGKTVGVTDKSYKFYVNDLDRNVRGAPKFYTHHLTEEQGWEFDRLWKAGSINFDGPPPSLYIPGPSTQEKTE